VPKAYGGSAPSREEAATIERAEARVRAEKRRAERASKIRHPEGDDPTDVGSLPPQ
jgi:hypothetical protein